MIIDDFEQKILERYLGNPEFVVRVRGEKKVEIIVYYNGIKYFDYRDGKINLNEAVFLPNNINIKSLKGDIPLKVKKDVYKINELNFEFKVGSYVREDKSKGRKFDLQISEEKYQVLKELKQEIESFFPSVEYEKIDNGKYRFFIGKEKSGIICFEDLYNLLIKGYNKCSSIKFHVDLVNKDISKLHNDFDESFRILDETMKTRINIYCSDNVEHIDDYTRTKNDTNTEKQYQQKLMNIMNDNKKRAKLCKKFFGSEDAKPFEMEYSLYSKEENEKSQSVTKGRIDNIFVKKDTLIMVELKMGTSVIAGTNGIHKHLLDLCNIFENNKNVLKEISNVINNRDRIINQNQQIKKYSISENNSTNLKYKQYYIICGYDEKNGITKQSVKNEIKRVYNETINSVEILKTVDTYRKSTLTKDNKTAKKFSESLKRYPNQLLNLTIAGYIKKLKDYNCEVTIYLANEDYTECELVEEI